MRVVLDTNVVISGIFFGGVPRAILDHLAEGRFELILTPAILDEYHRTYARLSAGHPEFDSPRPLLELLAYGTLHPDPPAMGTPILNDPDDEKFILCARDAHAIVVSGDQHLLSASGWEGIRVFGPRSLLDSLPT